MRKITLICFLLLMAIVADLQAQDFTRVDGTYRMRVRDSDPEVYITLPNSDPIPEGDRINLNFEELDLNSNRQILSITANPDGRFVVDDDGINQPLDFFIQSLIPGQGALVYAEPENASTPIAVQSEQGVDILGTSPEVGQWFFRGDNQWFNNLRIGETSARRVNASSGIVRLTGGGGTVFDFVEAAFDQTLSTDSNELSSNDFFISNPVNNILEISTNVTKIDQVEVYSLLGNKVLTQSTEALSSTSLDVAGLSAGVYLVTVDTPKGVFTTKVIKQ